MIIAGLTSSNNWYAAVAGLHPQSLRHSALYPSLRVSQTLHPQSLRHSALYPSLRVSQTLRPSYLSHFIAAAT